MAYDGQGQKFLRNTNFCMLCPQNQFRSRIKDAPVPMPVIDRSNKPSEISIQDRYYTNVLRRVIVPVKVMTLFQAMAQSNTHKNIETCGVLTGKLVNIFKTLYSCILTVLEN